LSFFVKQIVVYFAMKESYLHQWYILQRLTNTQSLKLIYVDIKILKVGGLQALNKEVICDSASRQNQGICICLS